MVEIRLGERERLAHVASIGLAQRVVPAFHMARFPTGFIHAPVPPAGKHVAIGLPEVPKTSTALIRRGNALPQYATSLLTAISNRKGDNLSGAPTQRGPPPALLLPRAYKAPHVIEFQLIARSRGQ